MQDPAESQSAKPFKKSRKFAWVKKFVYPGNYKAFSSSKFKATNSSKIHTPTSTNLQNLQEKRSNELLVEPNNSSSTAFHETTEHALLSTVENTEFQNIHQEIDDEVEEEDDFDFDGNQTRSLSPQQASTVSRSKSVSIRSVASTFPVVCLSTISIRSSTFSEASQPSTSATIFSDNQTLYTNSSTMGIAPASILDRHRAQQGVHRLNQGFYTNNNLSNNTFFTAHSVPRSIHTNNANDSLYDNEFNE